MCPKDEDGLCQCSCHNPAFGGGVYHVAPCCCGHRRKLGDPCIECLEEFRR